MLSNKDSDNKGHFILLSTFDKELLLICKSSLLHSLDVISTPSHNCVICFEVAWHRFPPTNYMGVRASWHGKMSCFGADLAFISVDQKSCATKHESQNLNLETHHPLKHVKFRWATQHVFGCPSNPSPPNI